MTEVALLRQQLDAFRRIDQELVDAYNSQFIGREVHLEDRVEFLERRVLLVASVLGTVIERIAQLDSPKEE